MLSISEAGPSRHLINSLKEPLLHRLAVSVSPLDYRYGRNEAKAIWSRDGRHSRQLAVERGPWCPAHMEMGRVSEEHDEIISRISSPEIVTADRVDEIERETRHDIMALTKAMAEQAEWARGAST